LEKKQLNPELAVEIWEALRPHISGMDTAAAEDFAQVCIENGVEAEEMIELTQDRDVKKAFLAFVDVEEEEVLDDEDDDYEELDFDNY
jgi:hypothetical protein